MAELNLKQVTDKLNSEFTGDTRKLIFWYDSKGEFAEDVDSLELTNAKVLHLAKDNQFYVKYFLECEDTTTSYLVYAPFSKPTIRENHLADTLKYSKEFTAEKATLLVVDLGMDERYKPVVQKYIEFFTAGKEHAKRTKLLYSYGIENYTEKSLEIALLSVLCKCKAPSFEEVLRTVLMNDDLAENKYLEEFKKFGLTDAFWRYVAEMLSYSDATPTLEKLLMSMFVLYIAHNISCSLPAAWDNYAKNMVAGYKKPLDEVAKNPSMEREWRIYKAGNVVTFLDSLMNSEVYGGRFDDISRSIFTSLRCEEEFAKMPIDEVARCSIFAGVDEIIIKWIIERLEMEDVNAELDGNSIPRLVKMRRQSHFGKKYRSEYFVLENVWGIISGLKYTESKSLNELIKSYTDNLYQMDRRYRYFYYYLDQLSDSSKFDKLKMLVENIYSNEYLSKICLNWNDLFNKEIKDINIEKQAEFYSRNVQYAKNQVVVIISDALRYEVAMSVFERLQANEKAESKIRPIMGTLPSITPYGMAALLPHKSLEIEEGKKVLVDGQKIETLDQRQAILQKYKADSICISYDELNSMNSAEKKSFLAWKPVTYVYHNQIDARGDNPKSENEVFNACEEAVTEIVQLVSDLTSANKTNFIITSDHGFMYRRSPLTESDKIGSISADAAGRRFALSSQGIATEGVAYTKAGLLLNNSDSRKVSYPIGADIFKVPGSGVNYVHGGCSPQELLIPLIEVKMEKGKMETTTAQISLVSLTTKITNLITSLDFVQSEPISDVVKETSYRIFFIDETGAMISNEHLYIADKKDPDTTKRVFRLRFSFKNKSYNKSQKYYLVAYDTNNDMEVMRHEVIMDIAFADDFGFGF